ncbi:MAG: bifunctional diguanylate cyclase/phosphohydrolase [Solirubrobacterales bacterium]
MSELSTRPRILILALLGVAIAGALLYTLHVFVDLGGPGLDSWADHWLYNIILALAAAACVARGVLVRTERSGWLALGIGIAAWTAADIYWSVELSGREEIPYPSIADALYLVFYPFAYAGIILIVRARVSSFPASQWLDGLIGALAATAVGAALLAPALTDADNGNTATVATNLAYPLGDLLLLSFVIGALTLTLLHGGARPVREWTLLAAGLLVIAIADGLFLHLEATGSYVEGSAVDALWPVGMILIALAAWAQTRPSKIELRRFSSLLFPCLFALVAIVISGWDSVGHLDPSLPMAPTLATALATATLALVVLRLFMALGENTRLFDVVRREAVTDALTGLSNRRLLLQDLARVFDPSNGRPQTLFALFDLDGFKAYNDSFGHSAGDLLLRRLGRNLEAAVRPSGTAYRLGGDEFCVIVRNEAMKPGSLLAAASAALTEEGEGFTIRSSHGSVMLPFEAEDPSTALRLADHRMYAEKGRRTESTQRQTHDVLVRLLREREPALGEHLHEVARLALELGRALDMDAEQLDILARAAELHDIGKMAIPDEVLRKPAPLDPAEWELVQSHTVIGQRILEAAAAMAPVARVVRSTHERWDGGGYPDGLAGEAIPLASRVIFVCDAFDAMTSGRPYRSAIGTAEAIEELRSHAGAQFDPALVELFCERIVVETTGAAPARAG